MLKTNLQNRPIVIGSPIEIEKAVADIRTELTNLIWIDRPYFIAQRFFRTENGRQFIFPETYAPDKPGSRNYQRVTPDNDFKGSFFFLVGSGDQDEFSANQQNYLTYPVSIIFSVNLELIDKVKLDAGLFTQELIRDVRQVLTKTMTNHEFHYKLTKETRDVREVFREFVVEDVQSFNRAPLQCFRFDLQLTIQEDCFIQDQLTNPNNNGDISCVDGIQYLQINNAFHEASNPSISYQINNLDVETIVGYWNDNETKSIGIGGLFIQKCGSSLSVGDLLRTTNGDLISFNGYFLADKSATDDGFGSYKGKDIQYRKNPNRTTELSGFFQVIATEPVVIMVENSIITEIHELPMDQFLYNGG